MDPALMVTPKQFLSRGLRLVKVDTRRIQHKAKIRKFRSFFGAHPNQCQSAWNDLFTTTIPEARVASDEADLFGFFAALNFLRVYDTEDRRAALLEMNEKPLRGVDLVVGEKASSSEEPEDCVASWWWVDNNIYR